MPGQSERPRHRFFILGLWMQPDARPDQPVWRISLEDPQKEARIGFKNLQELTAFLEKWMMESSTLDSNQLQPKEIEL
ncbi:MAG: hypothetical protein HUU23_16570 [Caldilineales bacterium]|nr:hypothetical protein [Caldilineales bacterium]